MKSEYKFMRTSLKVAIAILLFSVVVVTAIYLGIVPIDQKSSRALHAQLFFRKATGKVPDLSWVELWEMTRQPGGFSLDDMFSVGSSLEGALANPYIQAKDLVAGESIFRARCAGCHGVDGTGAHAPPLNRPGFKNGDSDLRIYK